MMELQIENVEPTIGLEVQEVMEGEGSGTRNYEKLMNKPSINEVELSGDKSFQELGLSPLSNLDIIQIINKASEGGIINGNV